MTKETINDSSWHTKTNCTHAHCPQGCEKPQPFLCPDGRMLCGKCSAFVGIATEVVPCSPQICED